MAAVKQSAPVGNCQGNQRLQVSTIRALGKYDTKVNDRAENVALPSVPKSNSAGGLRQAIGLANLVCLFGCRLLEVSSGCLHRRSYALL